MNPLTELQKAAVGLVSIILLVLGVWAYGAWEHHKGYQQRADEDAVIAEQQKKEAHNAVLEDQKQADSDRTVLIDYYNRLLSARSKLQPGGGQAHNPSGVHGTAQGCEPTEDDLREQEEADENTAKLLRVRAWGQRIGLKPE